MIGFAFKVVQFGYLKYDSVFAVQLRCVISCISNTVFSIQYSNIIFFLCLLLAQEQLQKSLDDLKRLGHFYPVG